MGSTVVCFSQILLVCHSLMTVCTSCFLPRFHSFLNLNHIFLKRLNLFWNLEYFKFLACVYDKHVLFVYAIFIILVHQTWICNNCLIWHSCVLLFFLKKRNEIYRLLFFHSFNTEDIQAYEPFVKDLRKNSNYFNEFNDDVV